MKPRHRPKQKLRRGFAVMSVEQRTEIARKGGLTISQDRRHMADIGREGGMHSHVGDGHRRRKVTPGGTMFDVT